MSYRRNYTVAYIALMAALWTLTKAQPSSSCVTTLTTLSPCLGYITGNTTIPTQTCCSLLDSVIKSSPQCICSAVNSPIPNIGLNINRTQALQLPNACKIQAPPLTQCNATSAPTSLPLAPSPMQSPSENNPDEALTPTSSPGVRQAGGGSKTVPSTGSVDRVSQHLLMFMLCVASVLN